MNEQPERTMSTSDLVTATDQGRRPQDDGMATATVAAQANGGRPNRSATSDDRGSNGQSLPLLPDEQAGGLRSRWDTVQTSFVDDPRHAVEQADGLVAEAITNLAGVFAQERTSLEEQWSRGDQVSTDDLRFALQRYRAFFHRLLSL